MDDGLHLSHVFTVDRTTVRPEKPLSGIAAMLPLKAISVELLKIYYPT